MKQTSVANLTEKSTYSSDDYVVVDNLTNTNKMKLNVIEDNIKEASKTYVENNYVITENTQFNISGLTFKLVKKEI